MAILAVLFDLGNTLVDYYASNEFPVVLRRCLRECSLMLGRAHDSTLDSELLERALLLNQERPDYAVRPLTNRLQELFGGHERFDEPTVRALEAAFLRPIFATAKPNVQAGPVLDTLRGLGIKTAIVSNTPWGSPSSAWREELTRHGLLARVDATVFLHGCGVAQTASCPF